MFQLYEANVAWHSIYKEKTLITNGKIGEFMMMFSVIIPSYNGARYIKKSIYSVLKQMFDDFEIIVVDDGSMDNTTEVVKSIDDGRINYIYQENGGVSSARNTGIKNAKGDYICFLDADDLWKPNHLLVMAKLIERFPGCSVYLTGYEILLCDGNKITKRCLSPNGIEYHQSDNVFKEIWNYGYFLHTNSIACKKSVFNTVGLFEVGVKNGEDDDMWYRLFAYYSVAISNEVTSTYVRYNSNATKERIFVKDWIFLFRVKEILESPDVSEAKKEYLCRLMEQRKISYVRHCILNKDKETAWKQLKTIDKRLVKKKKYIETMVALMIPSTISSILVCTRDKRYYRS